MKQGIEEIRGLKVAYVPEQANPAWYAMPVIFDKECFSIGLHQFVDALNQAGAVEADVPGSTCPLLHYALFNNPEKISKNYLEKNRIDERNFLNAINFHNSMFKLDVWYGPDRYKFIDNYLSIISSVAKRYHK